MLDIIINKIIVLLLEHLLVMLIKVLQEILLMDKQLLLDIEQHKLIKEIKLYLLEQDLEIIINTITV